MTGTPRPGRTGPRHVSAPAKLWSSIQAPWPNATDFFSSLLTGIEFGSAGRILGVRWGNRVIQVMNCILEQAIGESGAAFPAMPDLGSGMISLLGAGSASQTCQHGNCRRSPRTEAEREAHAQNSIYRPNAPAREDVKGTARRLLRHPLSRRQPDRRAAHFQGV
jgi:hypothetical protein